MTALSTQQIASVRELQAACEQLGVDAVVIGAIALRIGMADPSRQTEDVDVAVALDLDDFPRLVSLLHGYGWKQDPRREQRWRTPSGSRLDLIPAGAKLRQAHYVEWPVSKMRMSLIGFDHVFADALPFRIMDDLRIKIVPIAVLTLLKIVAYLDNPHVRQKDLQDLAVILARYDPGDSRRFSHHIIDAQLDYEAVGAYCIGEDLGRLCSAKERVLIETFMTQVTDEQKSAYHLFARHIGPTLNDDPAPQVRMLTAAFALGFRAQE